MMRRSPIASDEMRGGLRAGGLRYSNPSRDPAAIAAVYGGLFFDPSNRASLFQDAAGTIPVTSPGDPVGRMEDISGNGFHATQATAGRRPTYQSDGAHHWLAFDGVDDYLVTAALDWSGTARMTVVTGVRKTTDAAGGTVFSNAEDETGFTFNLRNSGSGPAGSFELFGDGPYTQREVDPSPAAAPVSWVLTGEGDLTAALGQQAQVRVDGADIVAGGQQGNGLIVNTDLSNKPLYIGRIWWGANYFPGQLFGGILLPSAITASERGLCEGWMAARTGIAI